MRKRLREFPVRFAFTLGLSAHAAFFLCAHLAFINADNFLRMAGLIGFRAVDFLAGAAVFFGADLPPHFAQRCFIAAEMRFRADALMRRPFRPLAGLACFSLGGRPRRAGWEPSPARAAIALFDAAAFLSELCHYALNVHVVLSLKSQRQR